MGEGLKNTVRDEHMWKNNLLGRSTLNRHIDEMQSELFLTISADCDIIPIREAGG